MPAKGAAHYVTDVLVSRSSQWIAAGDVALASNMQVNAVSGVPARAVRFIRHAGLRAAPGSTPCNPILTTSHVIRGDGLLSQAVRGRGKDGGAC